MVRLLLCALVAVFCVQSARAQSYIGGGGAQITEKGDTYQGGSIFDDLNKKLNQNAVRANGRSKADVEKTMNEMRGGSGTTSKKLSAVCPICREMMYRHSEDGFRCIPKTVDGDPMTMAEIKWQNLRCPVCQAKFLGALPGNLNTKNGVDRDTCMHSVGRACVQSNVWTCPDCGYAALVDSFGLTWDGKPIGDDTRAFVRSHVSPDMFSRMCKLAGIAEDSIKNRDAHNLRKFSDYLQQDDLQQDQINDWYKYDNAIRIYKFQKAPNTMMARLYLDGAHACRRELNGEIAVPLQHAATDEELSLALRRIQHDITAASFQIRRAHNQTAMIDPNRADIDPQILCESAELIMSMGERGDGVRIGQDREHLTDGKQFYSQCDMFVISLRYAGFLDRVGRMEEADAALVKAMKFIPADASTAGAPDVRDASTFSNKQLKVVREYVDTRRKCLAFEKECLNRAMWENLVAIHHHKVRFLDLKTPLAVPEKDQVNPAQTAYMIGELARRCKEPTAGAAFLAAAEMLIKAQFVELDKEELKLEAVKDTQPAEYAAGKAKAKALNTSWGLLQNWVADQSKLARTGGPLDDQIKITLDEVLKGGGIDPASFKVPVVASDVSASEAAAVARVKDSRVAAQPAAPQAVAPAKGSGKMTRNALFKLYFDAISKYVVEKKKNPASLADLVGGNYISEENACLNSKGQIVCPETGVTLNYHKSFNLGSAEDFVIFQVKDTATSMTLYANGDIRTPVQKE